MEPPVTPRLDWVGEVAESVLKDAGAYYPPIKAQDILKRYAEVILFNSPKVQGFCVEVDGGYLVGFNELFGYYRHEWTYAHELGHIALGHLVYRRDKLSPENVAALRKEAEWFAASLLMPEKWMRQLHNDYGLSSFSDLRRYVHLFDVSWKAMQIRLEELGLCTHEEMDYITRKIG